MKQYIKLIVIAVVFVVLICGAVLMYNKLSEDYENDIPENHETADTNETVETSDTTEQTEPHETDAPETEPSETDAPAELQIPDFTVLDIDGNTVQLSDFAGKPIIVNFWATWCGPCKNEMPYFQNMYEKYGDSVVFMMVNATDGDRDTVDKVKEYIADNGYTFPVYCDTKLNAITTYGVYAFPSTLLINADGSIYDARVGGVTQVMLERMIKGLLGE